MSNQTPSNPSTSSPPPPALKNQVLPSFLRSNNQKKKWTKPEPPPIPQQVRQTPQQKPADLIRTKPLYNHLHDVIPHHVIKFTSTLDLKEIIDPHMNRFDPRREEKLEMERIKLEKLNAPKFNKLGQITQQMDSNLVDEKTMASRQKAFKKRIKEWKGPKTALDEVKDPALLQEELKKRAEIRRTLQFNRLPWVLRDGIPEIKPDPMDVDKKSEKEIKKELQEKGAKVRQSQADLLPAQQLQESDWIGNMDPLSPSTYVLFVPHSDGYKVVPVSSFVTFAPNTKKQVLTLEEAEERMKSRNRRQQGLEDRWFMKKRAGGDEEEAKKFLKDQGLDKVASLKSLPKRSKPSRDVEVDAAEEDWDFDDDVSDDEGFEEGAWDQDNISQQRETENAQAKALRSQRILEEEGIHVEDKKKGPEKNRFEEERVLKRVQRALGEESGTSSDEEVKKDVKIIKSKAEMAQQLALEKEREKEKEKEKEKERKKREVSPGLLAMSGQKRTVEDVGSETDTSTTSRKRVKVDPETLPELTEVELAKLLMSKPMDMKDLLKALQPYLDSWPKLHFKNVIQPMLKQLCTMGDVDGKKCLLVKADAKRRLGL